MRSTVADVMTTGVASVTEDTGYKDIAQALLDQGVSALPVLDSEGGVVGVVSEEDLLHKEEFKDTDRDNNYRPPLRARLRSRLAGAGVLVERADEKAVATSAAELMTRPAVTVSPDAGVVEAARLMERRGVKRLPVVDAAGSLVGMVGRRDLLRVFLQDDEAIAAAVQAEIDHLAAAMKGTDITAAMKSTDITASVDDGRVELTGSVHHRSTGHTLARLVNRIEGVVSVDNRISWHVDDLLMPYAGL
ncbi:CBS domain-containing protein [Streptomonospora wellingtoniae]|uniref:CBS domain-containing protein n=1 Tax=Streptomonospora wellingtoniae TaxID=3075544 RepID=A0ABU2L069_9ACTN|nr:CBS domain-containing protein [Streptomonospora sp. DSM 45055]MDT0304920.1 CBS domain-containing protein [Streptomonospora sp. DSM 45055]